MASGSASTGGVEAGRTVRLLIACPDGPGLIAAVTNFLAGIGGNVVEADQHADRAARRFFMRLEVERESLSMPRASFAHAFDAVARRHGMEWRLAWDDRPARVALLVSRELHCAIDLLARVSSGELRATVPIVVSNHEAGRDAAERFGVRYEHVPVERGLKAEAEARLDGLLREAGVELVVLARYMQVLSEGFVEGGWRGKVINIHHSFLPAFPGARPYQRAHARGVKVIGATSHYVTAELDEGPIIAQATAPTSHRDAVADLVRKGRDLERQVLAEAVRLHLDDKVLIAGGKTVVFA